MGSGLRMFQKFISLFSDPKLWMSPLGYFLIWGLSFSFPNISQATNLVVPGGPDSCALTLSEITFARSKESTPDWIQYASQTSGIVLGSINDIVLTATQGALEVVSPGLSKWFPLANEIANVASTATGKEWIYSGIRKRIIDGVALGAIGSQSIRAGIDHGPVAGLLTFAVTYGLTYWFPNKYFHKIMTAVPNGIPEKYRSTLKNPAGQGFIGISMIVVLELVLENSQHFVQRLPGLIAMIKESIEPLHEGLRPRALISTIAMGPLRQSSRVTLLHLQG